jgi:putative membrane protein
MQSFRIRPLLSMLVLSAGVLVLAACGDDEPTGLEVQDGHVVGVAFELNSAIVTMSETAETRTETAAVLDLAATLITEHTASNTAFVAIGISPIGTDLGATIELEAADEVNALEQLSGDAFDDQYVQLMIGLHEYALEVLDELLIPDAEDADLRAELQDMRATIVAHLAAAEQVQADLEAAAV